MPLARLAIVAVALSQIVAVAAAATPSTASEATMPTTCTTRRWAPGIKAVTTAAAAGSKMSVVR